MKPKEALTATAWIPDASRHMTGLPAQCFRSAAQPPPSRAHRYHFTIVLHYRRAEATSAWRLPPNMLDDTDNFHIPVNIKRSVEKN